MCRYGSVRTGGAEGLSGNLLVLMWNISALAMFYIAPVLKGAATINAIAPVTFFLAAVVTSLWVRERYDRQVRNNIPSLCCFVFLHAIKCLKMMNNCLLL